MVINPHIHIEDPDQKTRTRPTPGRGRHCMSYPRTETLNVFLDGGGSSAVCRACDTRLTIRPLSFPGRGVTSRIGLRNLCKISKIPRWLSASPFARTLALPYRLVKHWEGPYTASVHKSRLGARPPRKRSAPVAGKWIRTDETPLLAGFRISGRTGASWRRSGSGSPERVAEQRMEVDSALPR